MKKITLLIFAFICAHLLSAQQINTTEPTSDEAAVKAAVERFLIAAGNYDLDAIPAMFTENANIGGAVLRDGQWETFTTSLEEFLEVLKSQNNPEKYTEPVSEYTVHIAQGMLAFVKADATLLIDGIAKTYNFDYFTLIKEKGVWKILNGSYVAIPVDK